jgi:hypothetical protein
VNVGRDASVIAVPDETISNLAGVSSVFVVNEGVVRQQTIEVGQKVGKFVEVISGLKGDEVIAATNLNQLVTGVKIAGSGEETGGADQGASSNGASGAEGRGGQGRGGRRGGGE